MTTTQSKLSKRAGSAQLYRVDSDYLLIIRRTLGIPWDCTGDVLYGDLSDSEVLLILTREQATRAFAVAPLRLVPNGTYPLGQGYVVVNSTGYRDCERLGPAEQDSSLSSKRA